MNKQIKERKKKDRNSEIQKDRKKVRMKNDKQMSKQMKKLTIKTKK